MKELEDIIKALLTMEYGWQPVWYRANPNSNIPYCAYCRRTQGGGPPKDLHDKTCPVGKAYRLGLIAPS